MFSSIRLFTATSLCFCPPGPARPAGPARSAFATAGPPGPVRPARPSSAHRQLQQPAATASIYISISLVSVAVSAQSTLKPLSAVAPRTLAATVQMGGKGKGGKGKLARERQVRPATFGVAVALKWNFNTGPRGVRPQIEL